MWLSPEPYLGRPPDVVCRAIVAKHLVIQDVALAVQLQVMWTLRVRHGIRATQDISSKLLDWH